MTAEEHVQLISVTKSFGSKTVLDGLDLSIRRGELLALLGPSGCGKTTTLRLLAGLEKADSGSIIVGGQDLTRVPVRRRNMGLVFQSYSLFPHMTAQENVQYGLTVRGVERAARRRRAGELLEMVGLSEHSRKHPAQLSGGQQQRVALARALAVEPEVLLLDEPLSALDAKVRVSLREEIRRIQLSAGTTALFVTHDQEEALTVADRVGVMKDGRIMQLDRPESVYMNPNSVFISEFVGATNRIPGTVEGSRIHVLGTGLSIANQDAPGSGRADALIRPEDIEIFADSSGSGRVLSRMVRGSTTSLMVGIPEVSHPLRVDVPSPHAHELSDAAGVRLQLRRDDAVVAPAAAEALHDVKVMS